MNLVYAASFLPVGALSDKVAKGGILSFGYFISAITCLGTAFLTLDFLVLIPIFVLAGFFTAITDTVEGAAAADFLPQQARGTGYGLLQTVNGIGDLISSAVVGALWIVVSPTVASDTLQFYLLLEVSYFSTSRAHIKTLNGSIVWGPDEQVDQRR